MVTMEPPSFAHSVELYDSVGLKSRNMAFLAKWVYDVYKKAYLPGIDHAYREILSVDKTKLSVFAILVDDLADNAQLRDEFLLKKAINIAWTRAKKYQNNYLEVTQKIWVDIIHSIQKYPRYDEFKNVFFFDLDQFFNSIKYGYLVNVTDVYSVTESEMYSPHNMMIIMYLDMDLMCSPDFRTDELWKLRPIFHHIQDIMHMGNMMNTYPRELKEKDFSCPIIALALRKGLIEKETIINDPQSVMMRLNSLIPVFKRRVEQDFRKIIKQCDSIESIDISDFCGRLRSIWEEFLERSQYWETAEGEETEPISDHVPETTIVSTMKWVRM